jgi:hypothetical protein
MAANARWANGDLIAWVVAATDRLLLVKHQFDCTRVDCQ